MLFFKALLFPTAENEPGDRGEDPNDPGPETSAGPEKVSDNEHTFHDEEHAGDRSNGDDEKSHLKNLFPSKIEVIGLGKKNDLQANPGHAPCAQWVGFRQSIVF